MPETPEQIAARRLAVRSLVRDRAAELAAGGYPTIDRIYRSLQPDGPGHCAVREAIASLKRDGDWPGGPRRFVSGWDARRAAVAARATESAAPAGPRPDRGPAHRGPFRAEVARSLRILRESRSPEWRASLFAPKRG